MSPDAFNRAWTPPQREIAEETVIQTGSARLDQIGARLWTAVGIVAILAIAGATFVGRRENPYGTLRVSRAAAETAAVDALQARGVSISPPWRLITVPEDGSGGAQQFVYDTAGAARWRDLLGRYLPKPRWRVRAAGLPET